MKNITSAQYGNATQTSVVLQTVESGAVCVQLGSSPDVSDGWREVFLDWQSLGGVAALYGEPEMVESLEDFTARNGYSVFALLDLSDIENRLTVLGLEKPLKSAATRAWIDATRLAFANSQPALPAPFTYQEVTAEVLALLV